MTNIEAKALALVNDCGGKHTYLKREWNPRYEALCRAIEQHEAFRQEVSDAAQEYEEAGYCMGWEGFERFIIIAKPDPLVRVINEVIYAQPHGDIDEVRMAGDFRAALEARGLEIREKGK